MCKSWIATALSIAIAGAALALSSPVNAQPYGPGYGMGPWTMYRYGGYGMGPWMMYGYGSRFHHYYDYSPRDRGRSNWNDENYGYRGYGPGMMWQYQRDTR